MGLGIVFVFMLLLGYPLGRLTSRFGLDTAGNRSRK